jgi:HEAT repeat protein
LTAQVSDEELKAVIADFLEMGHVDNIFEMFKREPLYYSWVGAILDDERFNVRLGISVLFEELKMHHPQDLSLAIPSLLQALVSGPSYVRGEAASVLGIIGTPESLEGVRRALDDASPQVVEIAIDVLEDFE